MRILYVLALLITSTVCYGEFTPITASPDSRLIYVSDSQGSDRNDCLSEAKPCQSLAAALGKMRDGYPDHVYLRRGDTWRDQVLSRVKSGRSSSEPAVVSYYGESGPRPTLENDKAALHFANSAVKNLHFVGLRFYAYKMDPKNPAFVAGDSKDGSSVIMVGGVENVLFEDVVFHYSKLIAHSHKGSKLFNLTLNRNIFYGSYYNRSAFDQKSRPSNLFISSVRGLILTDNVLYMGGWHPDVPGAAANMYNHCAYLNYGNSGIGLVVKGNIFASCASHGVHGRPGGLYENNFFARTAISLQMGYRNHPLPEGVKAQAIGNVITEGESMVKGNARCTNREVCTPALWGLETAEPGKGVFEIRNNIVASRRFSKDYEDIFKSLNVKDIHYQKDSDKGGNIVYKWRSEDQGTEVKYPDPGRTLADYYAALGGERDYHAAMEAITSRPPGRWDELMQAAAINAFIRQGYAANLPGDDMYLGLMPRAPAEQ